MKSTKPFNKGLKKMKDEFDDFPEVQKKGMAKNPKRIRREDFDQENDNLDDYDVYSD